MESIKYMNAFMKIKVDSHDDLPLNKILCFSVLNILCESVFQIESNYYPQIHINECKMSMSINFLEIFYETNSQYLTFIFLIDFLALF